MEEGPDLGVEVYEALGSLVGRVHCCEGQLEVPGEGIGCRGSPGLGGGAEVPEESAGLPLPEHSAVHPQALPGHLASHVHVWNKLSN